MGGANWIVQTPFEKLVLMANSATSILTNASMSRHYHAQEMDIHPLKNADVLILSSSAIQSPVRSGALDYSAQLKKFCETIAQITQVSGGHVIVPCRPTPLILDLFGVLYLFFTNAAEAANGGSNRINFPTFMMVSNQAKALVATADVDTEWLPSERQERSYHPDEPFFSNELISMGKLKLFNSIHEDGFRASLSSSISATAIGSSASLSPLVIFVGQTDMRSGDVSHLIDFFRQDPRCGVVAIDPDVAGNVGQLFEPFRRDDTKIQLFESYLDPRVDLSLACTLIGTQLTPRRVIAPPDLIQALSVSAPVATNPLDVISPTRISYVDGDRFTLKLGRPFERAEMDHTLAKTIQPRSLGSSSASDSSSVISSITANVTKRDGKILLTTPSSVTSVAPPQTQQALPKHLWGTITHENLLLALSHRFGAHRVQSTASADSVIEISDEGGVVVAQVRSNGSKTHISSSDAAMRRSIATVVASLTL
jgi:hypothetical protein